MRFRRQGLTRRPPPATTPQGAKPSQQRGSRVGFAPAGAHVASPRSPGRRRASSAVDAAPRRSGAPLARRRPGPVGAMADSEPLAITKPRILKRLVRDAR